MRRRTSRLHRSGLSRARHRLAAADLELLKASHRLDSPVADRILLTASSAANGSKLWFAVLSLLGVCAGRRGRRAALRGAVTIGLTSAVANGPLKLLLRRRRPPARLIARRPNLLMAPRSYSFPSGHAASAFGFATAVAAELPVAAVPAFGAAAVVAYSRVHTGVHFPGDVLAGAGLGVAAALVAGKLVGEGQELSLPPAERERLPRRAVVLTSPHAGSFAQLERARAVLAERGIEIVEEIPVDESARLTAWVERADRPIVVAAGGDGTVGAAAERVAGTGALLAILPLGTSNDVARSLGIPLDAAEAAALLADGVARTVDAGRITVEGQGQRYFVHAATVGLNVRFAQLAGRSSIRRRFGRMTYAVAATKALRSHHPFDCELHYGDSVETLRLAQLSIINAPVFGGGLDLRVPGARVDDRHLVVLALEQKPLYQLLFGVVLTTLGNRNHASGVHALRVRNLRVHVEQPLDVALDGEITATLPADFEVAPDALRVLTPLDPGF